MNIIDFAVNQDQQGNFDLIIGNNLDFAYVNNLQTLFFYQLFVDRRGTKQDASNPRDRGGWAGDIETKQGGYESGSFIWTKKQSRYTQRDMNEIAGYAELALAYFLSTGLARQIKVNVNNTTINGIITVDNDENSQFLALWQNMGNYYS